MHNNILEDSGGLDSSCGVRGDYAGSLLDLAPNHTLTAKKWPQMGRGHKWPRPQMASNGAAASPNRLKWHRHLASKGAKRVAATTNDFK